VNINKIKIKFCGFTDYQSTKFAIDLGVEFIGFVFHEPSIRNVSFSRSREISNKLSYQTSSKFSKVAVFCDADDFRIENIVNSLSPDFLQLHGNESPERISEIKKKFPIKIIKSFCIKDQIPRQEILETSDIVDYFLFDSFSIKSQGGTGKSFDWDLLKKQNFQKDWFLSGGLNINNVIQAIKASEAKFIDISSGIEEAKGVKSKNAMKEFCSLIKNYPK
jgi:phosphoribosylanthranilate isomerase